MTGAEKELVKKYPEAAAFAGIAESVWNGSFRKNAGKWFTLRPLNVVKTK